MVSGQAPERVLKYFERQQIVSYKLKIKMPEASSEPDFFFFSLLSLQQDRNRDRKGRAEVFAE